MKRTIITVVITTLVAITWGIAARGEVAFGGELILPVLAGAYAVFKEEEDEEEPRKKRTPRANAKNEA